MPEGSIRAVIALSLVIIFAILTVFLWGKFASGVQQQRIAEVANFDRIEFLRNNPSVRDVVQISPNAATNTSTIAFVMAVDPAAADFSKQLLTLVGTLMTAVAAFYFGARTASRAAETATSKLPQSNTARP